MTEPIWSPGPVRRQTANIRRFIDLARSELDPGIYDYRDLHRYSVENPAGFWRAVWDFCGLSAHPATRSVKIRTDAGRPVVSGSAPEFCREPAALTGMTAGHPVQVGNRRHRQLQLQRAVPGRGANGPRSNRRRVSRVIGLPATCRICRKRSSPCWRPPAWAPSGLPAHRISASTAWSTGWGRSSQRYCFARRPTATTARHTTAWTRSGHCRGDTFHRQTVVVPYVEPEPNRQIPERCLVQRFHRQRAREIEFNRLPFDHPVYILYSSGTTGVPSALRMAPAAR